MYILFLGLVLVNRQEPLGANKVKNLGNKCMRVSDEYNCRKSSLLKKLLQATL